MHWTLHSMINYLDDAGVDEFAFDFFKSLFSFSNFAIPFFPFQLSLIILEVLYVPHSNLFQRFLAGILIPQSPWPFLCEQSISNTRKIAKDVGFSDDIIYKI